MKKTFVLILAIMFAMVTVPGDVFAGFWDDLKGKVQTVSPRKKATVTTAVGGVRGARDESAETLYWKGREQPIFADFDELEKFNIALEYAMAGENEKAIAEFKDFISMYPESQLKGDAEEALAAMAPGTPDADSAPTPEVSAPMQMESAPADTEAAPGSEVQAPAEGQ